LAFYFHIQLTFSFIGFGLCVGLNQPIIRPLQLLFNTRGYVITLYLLFVLYKGLMMDQLNPKQKQKLMKVNISCALSDDLSFFICGWLMNDAVSSSHYTVLNGQIISR